MLKIKAIIFLMAFLTFSGKKSHDYYLSTTSIKWVPEKQQLQLTSRFFLEDIEAYMQNKQNNKVVFSPDSHPDDTDAFVKDFFLDNISLQINDSSHEINYLGREYQDEFLVVYAEVTELSIAISKLSFKSTFLLDFIASQQNIIHIKTPEKHKSFLLKNKINSLEFIVN
ncbi:MAG: hypothetical protein L7T62_01340 [Flavobacteriaceae bacterium]|nr:hypothetical protein [Flavobacteriaceae bacterium]